MSQDSMDEFFRMVGFDPSKQGDGASGQEGSSSSAEAFDADASEPQSSGGGSAKRRGRRGRKGAKVDMEDVVDAFRNSGSRKPKFVWDGGKFKDMTKKGLIFTAIALILILAFCYWWFHPSLSIHNGEFWMLLILLVALPLLVLFRTMSWRAARGTKKHGPNPGKAKACKMLSFIPIAVIAFFFLAIIAAWSFWPGNAQRYANILTVEDGDFASEIEEVDYNSIPVIDRESAVILGNRTLGEIPDYVSQFEISSKYSQINYQGRPVRVSPLNYADFFKWFTNKDGGIPAYVMVDMASQDTKIVRLDEPIRYVESDPFFNNIDRYVQLKYPTYLFEEKAFEIDEEGTPWWVCPVQTRTISLFGGETIERVVLVNACSGETQDYAIEDCPQWVDRAYPSGLLVQQYNWRGAYLNGWLNSWIGQSGVVRTTPGSNGKLGYNYIAKDDDVWVYTGVTSATSDNAIVGFLLANQRTGDARYYSVAGATEESAMASAEGQVQNLKYEATFPLLLNINGQPTYFMALKDSAGLAKKFAMLDIQRYQNVAVGDTVGECQKSYKALLVTNGALDSNADLTDSLETASGTIVTMTEAVMEGNSHFYLTLDGVDGIFDCPLPGQIEIVGYKAGDKITLKYVGGETINSVQEIVSKGASVDAAKSESQASAQNSAKESDGDAAQASAQDDSKDTAQASAQNDSKAAAKDATKS